MASRFAVATNEEIQQIIKQANKLFPKYTKKATKVGLEVLTRKALSGWLEFIDETGEKVYFYLKMQSLELLYLAEFSHK